MSGLRSTPLLLTLALFAAAPAYAQFPFLETEAKAPDVRIAGTDPLIDELDRFVLAVDASLAEAEAELHGLEADGASGGNRAVLQRSLLSLTRQRVQHLTSARAAAYRARDLARAPPPRPQPTELVALVSLARLAARLNATQRDAERYAGRLEAMAVEPSRGAGGAREIAERAVRVARARAARARAYEAQARARQAEQSRDAARGQLVLSPHAEAQAKAHVEEAEQRLARLEGAGPEGDVPVAPAGTSSLAAERFAQEALSLTDARGELRTHRARRVEAELQAARALAWGYAALAEAARPVAADPVDIKALRTRRLALEDERTRRVEDQARLRAEFESSEGKAWEKLLQDRLHTLDALLAEIVDEQRAVEEAVATVDVVQSVLRDRRARPGVQSALLIVFTLLLGFALIRQGGRLLTLIFAPGLGWLSLSDRASARAQAIASIVWPVGIALGCAAVIVWPVLGLELTVLEALEVLERPLFYVEDTGVSVISLAQFVLTIWAAVVLSRLLRGFLTDRLYTRTRWDIGLTNALDTLVHYLVLLTGIVLGLRSVGVGFSSLAILASVIGIGIGFGLRNITENFISGLIILAERPIKIGDFIEVKDGEVEGRVESIRARSTTVTTRDNISMIIPNSEFVARPVVNWSHGDPKVRVKIPVGVAYGSDTDLVRRVLLEVAGRHGQVLKKPAPEVQFAAFGASSLDFLLLIWIEEQAHRFRIASDLHFAVDKAFRKRGIEIAFPQLDLHLRTMAPVFAARLHEVPSPPPIDEGPKIPDRKSILTKAVGREGSAGPREGEGGPDD